jgi:hypothetical protein
VGKRPLKSMELRKARLTKTHRAERIYAELSHTCFHVFACDLRCGDQLVKRRHGVPGADLAACSFTSLASVRTSSANSLGGLIVAIAMPLECRRRAKGCKRFCGGWRYFLLRERLLSATRIQTAAKNECRKAVSVKL